MCLGNGNPGWSDPGRSHPVIDISGPSIMATVDIHKNASSSFSLNNDNQSATSIQSPLISAIDTVPASTSTLATYYRTKISSLQIQLHERTAALQRLQASRNALNTQVRSLKEELMALQEPSASVGEVIKPMGKKKVLVKMHPDGKFAVDVDKSIDVNTLKQGQRVALKSDSYTLFRVLPSKVDPLVSLMMVEKVPDSTYDMIGGLDKQIKEIKEVIELPIKHPELFESLGIAQPKGVLLYGPPGTGKTLLARAVAHHTDCKFIRVSARSWCKSTLGRGARMVRELFVMAREHAPSIIFMDEIDSIGSVGERGRWERRLGGAADDAGAAEPAGWIRANQEHQGHHGYQPD